MQLIKRAEANKWQTALPIVFSLLGRNRYLYVFLSIYLYVFLYFSLLPFLSRWLQYSRLIDVAISDNDSVIGDRDDECYEENSDQRIRH